VLAIALGGVAARAPHRAPLPMPVSPAWEQVTQGRIPENAPAQWLDGTPWLGANDLARLLDATKFWRSDVRKLTLRAHGHRVQLTADNPFALIDDRAVLLTQPVRSVAGELLAPITIVDSLPRDTSLARLVFDGRRGVVFRVPASGIVGTPRVIVDRGETRILFPVDRAEDAIVIGRARGHFRVRFVGFFVGFLPDTFPVASLVTSLRPIPSAAGSAFELSVSPQARGFQLVPDAEGTHVVLSVSSGGAGDLEAFAPEGPPGPRPVRVIVIDPGHGGGDAGYTTQGAVEKDLTLQLALRLRLELERRLPARVILTREDDRALTVQERAERANRARADLVLSLHFDAAPVAAAQGVTAWCPPATYGSTATSERLGGASTILVVPWRDVATRHAVRSRELAEAVLSMIELHGLGPTRLREVLPFTLLGVNAPGLMLECATLTSPIDRARLLEPDGIPNLAATLAAGIDAYARAQ
jgi:N-acetylmuramoyl-L-alanine amidase